MQLKVVHNKYLRGIFLIEIMTLKYIVSNCFSAVWKGLKMLYHASVDVNRIKDEGATAASGKHELYTLTTMMNYLKKKWHNILFLFLLITFKFKTLHVL